MWVIERTTGRIRKRWPPSIEHIEQRRWMANHLCASSNSPVFPPFTAPENTPPGVAEQIALQIQSMPAGWRSGNRRSAAFGLPTKPVDCASAVNCAVDHFWRSPEIPVTVFYKTLYRFSPSGVLRSAPKTSLPEIDRSSSLQPLSLRTSGRIAE